MPTSGTSSRRQSSVSLIWPSDSVSRYHVDRPCRRLDHQDVDHKTYSEYELAQKMDRLDIKQSLSPSPNVSRERQLASLPVPPSTCSAQTVYRGYRSLNMVENSPWSRSSNQSEVIQEEQKYPNKTGVDRGGIPQQYRQSDEPRLSPDLIAAIFCNITNMRAGKRFARLQMNDSGRWRVLYIGKTSGAFPTAQVHETYSGRRILSRGA